MTNPSYFDAYTNLAMSRDDNGVLVVRFHTSGGPIVFTGQTHEDLPKALENISLDAGNRAMVLTGTGDAFMDQIDGRLAHVQAPRGSGQSALLDHRDEGRQLPQLHGLIPPR